MTLAEFWAQCLRRLHSELSEAQFNRAIVPLTVGEENGLWIIYAKNQFAVNLVRSQYAEKLAGLRQEIAPQAPDLSFKIGVGQSFEMASPLNPLNNNKLDNLNNLDNKLDSKKIIKNKLETKKTETTDKTVAPMTQINPINHINHKNNLNNLDETPTRKRSAQEILQARLNDLNNKNNKNNHKNQDNQNQDKLDLDNLDKEKKKPLSAIERAKAKEEAEQRHQQTNLSPEYTFDNLVEGKGNHLAVAVAKSIAEKPGDSMYNPFFVYGSTGLGKTHLVEAIGNELIKLNPKARVRYMHANDYLKTFMATVRNKSWDSFKQQYLHYDLLIIDDIQFIQGKDRTMEEFFFLFEHFHSRNQQIILTCDQLPSSLENMEKRLISRFSWGMTIKLEPPELEMRIDILERKAQAAGIELFEDAALFIAQNVKQNVRELEGALNRVLARCRFEKRNTIDIDLATDALQDIVASNYKPITIELIMKVVADYHHIRMSDLLGKKRTRNIARPRQMAMALAKELTNMSLPAIGDAFGGRDHTTVMHAVKTISQLRHEEPELGQDYEKLLILIQN